MPRLLVTGASGFLGWNLLTDIMEFPQDLIQPARQADITTIAPRSPDTSLDSSLAFSLGYNPLTLKQELINLLDF